VSGSSESKAQERLRGEAMDGRDLLARWSAAEAESGASKTELGLAIVSALLGRWQLDDAARVLQEIEGVGEDPSALAAAIVLRQLLASAREQPLDLPLLDDVIPVLVGAARWTHALDACGLLAAHTTDHEKVRLYRALAIGCAEAAGASYRGSAHLRLLAAAELDRGEHARCLAHLEHALERLGASRLIGARVEEGRCHELAGDALRLVGDVSSARARYERSIERFGHPDIGARHRERVGAKLDALA
jgi:hypothetical protein